MAAYSSINRPCAVQSKAELMPTMAPDAITRASLSTEHASPTFENKRAMPRRVPQSPRHLQPMSHAVSKRPSWRVPHDKACHGERGINGSNAMSRQAFSAHGTGTKLNRRVRAKHKQECSTQQARLCDGGAKPIGIMTGRLWWRL